MKTIGWMLWTMGGLLIANAAAASGSTQPQIRVIQSGDAASTAHQAGDIYRPPSDDRYVHIRLITREGDQVSALVGQNVKVAARTTPQARTITAGPTVRLIQNGQSQAPTPSPIRVASTRRVPPKGVQPIDITDMLVSFDAMAYMGPGPVQVNGVRLFGRDRYAMEIFAATSRYGVEEALVRAIIHAESAFNPVAVSHAGAQGLMQLMPATARRFGVTNSFDPSQNILGGTQYLAWLLDRYNGDIVKAAAAYNAGEGAVDRHGGVPPYRETRGYVQRVNHLLPLYRQQLASLSL